MARSPTTSVSVQAQGDSGGVLWSFIQGEQLAFGVTLGFIINTTGYTFEAVVMEGLNVLGNPAVPTSVRPGGVNTQLTVVNPGGSNAITIRFPETLGATWAVQPQIDVPVHGFFELRVTEPSGAFPQTWKPLKGVVEIAYSPTYLVP